MTIKAKPFFSPDHITTRICTAVRRDMERPTQLYGRSNDSIKMLSNRQRDEIDKKYVYSQTDDNDLEVLTYIKFLFVNEHMSHYSNGNLVFPEHRDPLRPQSYYPWIDNVLLRARWLMHYVLSSFTEDEWFQHCKHGTGSSLGVSFKDTSLEAKSIFPITCTRTVSSLLDRYLEFDSQLNSALLYFNEAAPIGERYRIVEGSRATTVPKSNKIRRMIAIEPTGNMFFQQGLMAMMYERMKLVGLDVERLPALHRKRALQASVSSEEATIDWSSASDCVSIDLLRWLLPPMWFECCNMVRSPVITMCGDPVELNMFSTMGNAVTFPLETLVFWTLAQSVRLENMGTNELFPEWEDITRCSVFGDDCIVPTSDAPSFISVMESVGFMVNEEKSYIGNEGFRESCGGDYLRGEDVRPYCLKGPTSSRRSALAPWLYIVANSLIPKYRKCFGELAYMYDQAFFRLLVRLFDQIHEPIRLVPDHFPDDAGLKISDDVERFVKHYPCRLGRIGVDVHGTYDFLYHRFVYRQYERRIDDLHYATWLRQPGGQRTPWWPQKKKGGYVVARGQTGHWSVPRLNKTK